MAQPEAGTLRAEAARSPSWWRRCRARTPSTRTGCCGRWRRWRTCASAPSARSRTCALTASRHSPATCWRSPTTWTARSRRSMPNCARPPKPGVKALLDGVELTERELLKVLEKHGVKRFEPEGREVRSQPASGDVRTAGSVAARRYRRAGGAARLHDRRADAAPGAGGRRQGWAQAAPANDNPDGPSGPQGAA